MQLSTMQGTGTARIPMDNGISLCLSPHAQREVIAQVVRQLYPHISYGRALAKLQDDSRAAQLIREATVAYFAAPTAPITPAPTMPAVAPATHRRRQRAGYTV